MINKKKSIVIISTLDGLTWGGSEELWYDTALTALENGYEVHVSLMGNNIEPHHKIKELQIKGAILHFAGDLVYEKNPLHKRIIRKIILKKGTPKFHNRFTWIEKWKPDKVLVNAATIISLTHFPDLKEWMQQTQIKFDTLLHHHVEAGLLPESYKTSLQQILARSENNFFVALRNLKVLERQLALKIPAVRLVQNPINIKEPKIIAYPENDRAQIAVVARLDCNCKGQDILLEALASPELRKENIQVNFYGRGADEGHLINLIQFYGLQNIVTLKGHINDIESVWRENQILLLPSLSEGTPISLVEAMCCGRAAIVTDVGDNARLVQEGVTGFVAPVANTAALNKTLKQALDRKNEWREMGENAFKESLDAIDTNTGQSLFNLIN